MGFKLNIGKDGGGGSTGFSLNQSLNMIKAKSMSSQMVGTDVMKDGYYNTVNESGAGSPSNFNKGFESLPESVQNKIDPEGRADGMPMNDMAYKNDDGGVYARSCFNVNDPDIDPKNELTRNSKGEIDDDSKTTEIDYNLGRGGKGKGTKTETTVRRIGAPGEEMAPDARRRGIGRIGTQTKTNVGSSSTTKTKLAGTDGFRKDGSGYIKEASVNNIKTRGGTTNNKPTASTSGLSARAKKDKEKDGPTMMYGGKKH